MTEEKRIRKPNETVYMKKTKFLRCRLFVTIDSWYITLIYHLYISMNEMNSMYFETKYMQYICRTFKKDVSKNAH